MPAAQPDDQALPATRPRLAMIGAGQMALALGSGFCRSGEVVPSSVRFFDPSPESRDRFLAEIPSSTSCPSAAAAVSSADLVFLAVKPQHAAEACRSLVASLDHNSTVVSVVAGLSIAQLSGWLGMHRIIRVMPNTPCLVGKGVLAVAHHPALPQAPLAQTERLLSCVGHVHRLSEGLLNAVTGLSGSGPGFVAIVAEALADGGVLAGLPRDLSLQLAIQTLAGTAALLESTGEHPAVLRDRVASPAGTTIAGIASLERSGLRAALIDAVKTAADRSADLASG